MAAGAQISPRLRVNDSLKGLKRQSFGVAARTVITIKFGRSERDIQVLRGRVQTHNGSRQLVLQMITVYVNLPLP
jgi:hypothetical protein